MKLFLTEESRWLRSGIFFLIGLWGLRWHVQKGLKWKGLKKHCIQKTRGVVAVEQDHGGGKSGGQEITVTYDADERTFNQMVDHRYKRGTFQWRQKVTVYYDPLKPEKFYVEENYKQIRSKIVWGLLLMFFWCLFFGTSMVNSLLLLF